MWYLLRPVTERGPHTKQTKQGRGDLRSRILTPEEVLILAEQQDKFTGITHDEFLLALQRAQENVARTARLRILLPGQEKKPDGSWGAQQ